MKRSNSCSGDVTPFTSTQQNDEWIDDTQELRPQRRRSSSEGSWGPSDPQQGRLPDRPRHDFAILRREDSTGSRSGFPGRSVMSTVSNPFRPVPAAVARISSFGATAQDCTTNGGESDADPSPGKADVISRRPAAYRRSSTGNRRSSNENRRGSMASEASVMSITVAQVENLTKDERAAKEATSRWRTGRREPRKSSLSKIFDDPATVVGYSSVPLIDIDRLPRGGLSLETKAVGRIQFGIPPETIKDSMRLGMEIPSIYIVPVERFCREMGPALGINVAEFEFPAYFNYFIHQKQCTLIVDSEDAEANIRRVFGETLLGPAQFRNHDNPKPNEEEDFDPRFPKEARPNFYNEFCWFRGQEATESFDELCIDMLIDFCHFSPRTMGSRTHDRLGVPPSPPEMSSLGFFDTLDALEESDGSVHDLQDSSSLYHEASMKLQESKRFHEVLKEKQMGRRHTTWLDSSDNEKEDDDEDGQDRKTQSTLKAPAGESSHENQTASCEGAGVTPSLQDSITIGSRTFGSHTRNQVERPKLRRVVSDPDIRMKSLSDSQSTGECVALAADDSKLRISKRNLMESGGSKGTGGERDGFSFVSGASFLGSDDEENRKRSQTWMYSQAKWLGEVATVFPSNATAEERASKNCARVEIFKMTGGTEYIVHDIDENNIIIGKARFSGTVRVPDEIAVEGFSSTEPQDELLDNVADDNVADDADSTDGLPEGEKRREIQQIRLSISTPVVPPTFHPPSFGVTVLGNSHGFDKNGSTSGYVLWINGRGVMIDPPPYSSAALEREGIRPRMIMAIIITHCHADHDAGTFQKVMTGSRVAVITTPTIYKSFIRKYAALSGLSPALLRHSHRHRPAIVGQPLKFQGATFHFTYTLHTIPCIAFQVEWRGRSMIFTGDHMNIPEKINELQSMGVLSKERADTIRQLPLKECDLLLHESGQPPIHTPLDVLLALPEEVKKRLYVVHTSALPKECELRVAPTGTAGTIRLDELKPSPAKFLIPGNNANGPLEEKSDMERNQPGSGQSINTSSTNETETGTSLTFASDFAKSLDDGGHPSLSVAGDFFAPIPAHLLDSKEHVATGQPQKRKTPPLVLSRPTCVSDAWFILNLLSAVPFLSSLSYANTMEVLETAHVEVYCAGEVVLPAHRRSGVLCVVWEGTCIEREPEVKSQEDSIDEDSKEDDSREESGASVWHAGDWTGPKSLQPECALSGDCTHRGGVKDVVALSAQGVKVILVSMKDLHKILKSGSPLYRKYLDSLIKKESEDALMDDNGSNSAIGLSKQPHYYDASNFLRTISYNSALGKLTALQKRHLESLAEGPRYFDARQSIWQVGSPVEFAFLIVSGTASFAQPPKRRPVNRRCSTGSISMALRSPSLNLGQMSGFTTDKLINVSPNSEYSRLEIALQIRGEEVETESYEHVSEMLPREERSRNARDRFANKVLARLYARNAYTSGIVFSRGHFLSDTSRMVSGLLAFIQGQGDGMDASSCELKGECHYHSSNIVAGDDGCVVMVFPRESLIAFFDAHPGVLLSLLGTQAVV